MGRQRRTGDYPSGFLFSPSSCYPTPAAYVIDHTGTLLHAWSHTAHQPSPEDSLPSYLRGWNHVEVDGNGNLFAIVPLRALLKLTPDSELEWSCDIAVHHDVAITDGGGVLALTESPRLVSVDGGGRHVVLDNLVTLIDQSGTIHTEFSIYDVLRTDPRLRQLIGDSTRRRNKEFQRRGWPNPHDAVPSEVVEETNEILRSAGYRGELRQALRRLRDLPGRPCDVLHTNTLEVLVAHPDGIWDRGDVLLCMRELNLIAVVDIGACAVRWWWGPGDLSGPHQPVPLPDGRIVVFDNGVDVGRTRLVAVDPSTRGVVWEWEAQPPQSFFCPLAGGCERLANGNLLVTNSTGGSAFELTMDGEVVWQIVLPADVYGAQRGRVSIYRMSGVGPEIVARLATAVAPTPQALSPAGHAITGGRR